MRKLTVLITVLLVACSCDKLVLAIEIADRTKQQTLIDLEKAEAAVEAVCGGSASTICEQAERWLKEVQDRLDEADRILCGAKIAAGGCPDPPALDDCLGQRDLEGESAGELLRRARELEARVFEPE